MKNSKTISVPESDRLGARGDLAGFFQRCIQLFGFNSMMDAWADGGFLNEPDSKEVRKTLRSYGFPIRTAVERIQLECAVDDEFELQVRDILFCFLEIWEKKIAINGGTILKANNRERIAFRCGKMALSLFISELETAFRSARIERKRQLKVKRPSVFQAVEKKRNLG